MGALLELACVALLASWHNYPVDTGHTMRTMLRDNISSTLQSVISFIQTLTTSLGHTYSANSHPILQCYGEVSSRCGVIKTMPRSNKHVCVEKLSQNHGLLKDALSELEEVNSEDFGLDLDEEAEQYTERDSQILNPSKGLIKTSIVLTKKTMDTIKKSGVDDSSGMLLEYDRVVEIMSRMSSGVDDLALTLYPPVDWAECKHMNESLKEYLQQCLEDLSSLHFMKTEESVKWRDFISKAIVHNFAEVQRVLITNGMAEIKIA